jgi:hypothetical protein
MDLTKIAEVLAAEIPKEMKRLAILMVISEDENAIPSLLQILANERQKKKELILEMNVQLSRAHMGLIEPKLDTKFMIEEINKFYKENKEQLKHCFKMPDLP